MNPIHINEFKKSHTQAEIAGILGITQGGVSLAIKSGRDIYFTPLSCGGFSFYEVKKPRRKAMPDIKQSTTLRCKQVFMQPSGEKVSR